MCLVFSPQPDPSKCRAVGAGLQSAMKHQFSEFKVEVADIDGDSWTSNDGITITAEVTSRADEKIVTSNVVSETLALYKLSYQPIKCGQHEINVKVNGMPINGSPFSILVDNKPHPNKCKAIREQSNSAEKNNPAKFMVQLADEDGDPCVTEQEVMVEVKCLVDGSIIKANVVSQTPATYEVAYQPSKSGEYEIIVKVNGMHINGSPFALLVYNIPDPQNCKAVGIVNGVKKNEHFNFIVQLADKEGDPCVTKQEVTAELKFLADDSITKANVVSQTPATYEVDCQPSKSGEHKVIVKVNGMEINGSPFALLVYSIPDPQNCKAVGKEITRAEKHKTSEFMVQLADAEGDPCVTEQKVVVELKSPVDGSVVKADVVSKTPATYAVSYQPSKSEDHELSVKVNGMHINGSPFRLLVYNIPDLLNCKAVEIVESAKKNEHFDFIVQLADKEGDPCVTKQEVTAELKFLADDSITKANVVSQTPATYEVDCQPSKSGEYEIIVKVNGMKINGSPFALLVYSIPDPQNCKAVGKEITRAEKHKTSEFMVQLADAEGDPCVTKQDVVVELKALVDGSIINADLVSKTPAPYAVSYRPSKSGDHELSVKVNGMHINCSPFRLLVYNIPDLLNCKAVGIVKRVMKNEKYKVILQLADKEGDPCVTKQEVTAELKSLADRSIIKANVVSQTPATYEVDCQPSKNGEHELNVRMNGMEINGSPFQLLVYNIPDAQSCEAVGEGITKAEKYEPSEFIIQLADAEGDPCVTEQEVVVEFKSLVDDSITKADVVSKTPATYAVSYQPSKSEDHELSVKVNGMHINGSPFRLLVYNIPDLLNCKAVEIVESAKKNEHFDFIVQLADKEGDPCVTKQEVTAELKFLADDSITKANVVSQTPATYEVDCQPSKSGEYEIIVKVNGMKINGSPFALLVYSIPDPQNCKAVGKEITRAEKHKTSEFMVQLADAEGDPCVTKQEVVVELKALVNGSIINADLVSKTPAPYAVSYRPSKSGDHELSVKVNGMHINCSPFRLLVYNIPDLLNCKAVGIVKRVMKNEKYKVILQLADKEGDPCVTKQEVTAELKSLADRSIIKANVVSQTPATYEVDCQPSKNGEHELNVRMNGMEINGSPFQLLVYNIPDAQSSEAVGEGITKAEKYEPSEFIIQLADAEGDPCVTEQEVVVELKSLVDDSITKAIVVNKTPATYAASYRPKKSRDHELSVKVNDIHIEGSPFPLFVVNMPHTKKCKATGEHVNNAEKNKAATFLVQLADADGEPCASQQVVTVELKALVNGSITEGSVVSKTPATYEVSYQPRRSGRHNLGVKVNGMPIKGSPFALFVYNIPDPQNCKIREQITRAEKQKTFKLMVELADTEGDPCVTKQEVVVELKSLVDGSFAKANVVSKTPATYAVSCQSSKSGDHELSVKINDIHIEGSPFAVFVVNMPHTKKCKAIGEHVNNAEKNKAATFLVQLADADGEPCVTEQEVAVELKTLVNGSITEGSVVSITPAATYEVSYQPRRSGRHNLGVKVNGMPIKGSPFALFVHNIPDPQNCKVREQITRAEKQKTFKLMVELADTEGDPCVTKQEVVVELKSLVDGSFAKANVVSKTPATYAVSCRSSKSGDHELSVKVNDIHIEGSPFPLFVVNIPHTKKCKAIGEHVNNAEKNKAATFLVQLADADGEPCASQQVVTVELKALVSGSITEGSVVSKTPNTYEVSYQPSETGRHSLGVKVNGTHISGSPFALFVYNIPDPQNCKAVEEEITRAEKHIISEFMVQLADAEGDPCVTKQEVVVELKSLVDGSITKADIVSKPPATYAVSYRPSKSGNHELSVKVNGMHINSSPFALLVCNIPDLLNCKAVGVGIKTAEKHKTSEFMVQLADAEGDPCVTEQEVVVELKSLVDSSITKANVVSKTPATYAVSYQPSKSGDHELTVKVNDIHIEGSPFPLSVVNMPHTENCKAIGEHVNNAEKNKAAKFLVQLADEDGEPCASQQVVTVELKALVNGSTTEGSVVSKTSATYEVSYQPRRSGEHELSVKVNGMHISGSPFALLVDNIPDLLNCKKVGIVNSVKKNEHFNFIVQLADKEGDPCVTKQEVTAELKFLADNSITKANVVSQTPATYEVDCQPSKNGEHKIIVKVNGMDINGSPFALLVYNLPAAQNCSILERVNSVKKKETFKFTVQLADEESDPCTCVTNQEVTAELKSPDDSIIKAKVVRKSPATCTCKYEVSCRPRRIGRHELGVKVNGMHISGSPSTVFVYNTPDPQNCKAVGVGIKTAEKYKTSQFMVQLADAEGDPCVTEQEVVVELIDKSLVDDSIVKANVVIQSPATYAVSYQPSKSGNHELSVKVKGTHIEGSPFPLVVANMPHTENCKAIGEHVKNAEKNKAATFLVQLADADGEPCASQQVVTVELKALVNGSITEGSVVSKTPATYEVSYQPRRSGEHELSVKANGVHINGSPFEILVHNIPDPQNCRALGIVSSVHVKKKETYKFTVQLADEESDLCVTNQEVTAELKSLADEPIIKAKVVSNSPAKYEVSCEPKRSGRHELSVKVNGVHINGSPFTVFVDNIPDPQNCTAVEIVNSVKKHENLEFNVELVDAEGEPCVKRENVTAELICADDSHYSFNVRVVYVSKNIYKVSCQPRKCAEYKLMVKVNGMEINSSPFVLLVYNDPLAQNCIAFERGIEAAMENFKATFLVQLEDEQGDPCVTKQEVTAELKSNANDSLKANVVRQTPATYEVAYQPSKSGEYEIIVKVNGMEINGSPFKVHVCINISHWQVKTLYHRSGSGFPIIFELTKPCTCTTPPKLEVTVTLENTNNRFLHHCKAHVHSLKPEYRINEPEHYDRDERHRLTVYVNGMTIKGSSWIIGSNKTPMIAACD